MLDDVDELLNEGLRCLAYGLPMAALLNFEEATRVAPQMAEPHYNAGLVCLRLDRWDQAIQEFEEAARLDPGNVATYDGMATAFRQKGNRAAQRRLLEHASKLPVIPWRHHLILGDLAELQHDYDKALKHYLIAKNGAAGVHGILAYIGYILLRLGRETEARDVLRRAVSEEATEPKALYNLGLCELRLHHYSDAYSAFQAALDVDPEYVKALAKLAGLELRMGRWHRAWKHFAAGVRLDVKAQMQRTKAR